MNMQAACDFEFSSLSAATNYRQSIVKKFRPYLQGDILEIGGGIGQISTTLLEICRPKKLTIVEPNADFCRQLRSCVPTAEILEGYESELPKERQFNAIVAVNVLEHVEHDTLELTNWRKRLLPNGSLCLFVPARPELYSKIDASFGHFRRYRKKELLQKLSAAGFQHVQINYFNLLGYFAWLFNFKILSRLQFNTKQVAWFDRYILPVSQNLEGLGINWFGQSLWAHAQSPPQR
jgi:phospholipid N-methyltransferase